MCTHVCILCIFKVFEMSPTVTMQKVALIGLRAAE